MSSIRRRISSLLRRTRAAKQPPPEPKPRGWVLSKDLPSYVTPEHRAKSLLKDVLSESEYKEYQRTGKILITASDGTRWEIGTDSYSGNLKDIKNRRQICAHPQMTIYERDAYGYVISTGRLPYADAWVAQILELKTDADRVREVGYGYAY